MSARYFLVTDPQQRSLILTVSFREEHRENGISDFKGFLIHGKDPTVHLFSSPMHCFPFRKMRAVRANGQLGARTPRGASPRTWARRTG